MPAKNAVYLLSFVCDYQKKDRKMLNGTIKIGGQEWVASEEKRGGPQTQLLSLSSKDTPGAGMQIRLGAGQEAKSLEEVEQIGRA